ncbi:MAG: aminopeptidase P family protein [Pirellulales bacterium]|nr:aminopeptidase P family protein [Pirellulales bacterium]
MDCFATRRDRVRRTLARHHADAVLVTNFTNVTYLTGFTGDDSYLLVDEQGEVVLSDPRYTTQLDEQCPGVEVCIRPPGTTMLDALKRVVAARKTRRLAVEGQSMTVGLRDDIAATLPQVKLATTNALVEHFRQVKDRHEVAAIRQAVYMAQKGFDALRAALQRERTEKDLADELEFAMRRFGARDRAFASIVAAGPRAALPHATTTLAPIGKNDFVLVDWGAHGGLYRSDLTRVLVTGKISPKLKKIYKVVLDAQLAAIEAIRPGVVCEDVDAVARRLITKAGFGRQFGHGLGHGIGLDIHEGPRLAVGSRVILRPGMVVTVEPGIYLPGWGGVRIEDDVLVTRAGYEVLTSVPKRLDESIVALA